MRFIWLYKYKTNTDVSIKSQFSKCRNFPSTKHLILSKVRHFVIRSVEYHSSSRSWHNDKHSTLQFATDALNQKNLLLYQHYKLTCKNAIIRSNCFLTVVHSMSTTIKIHLSCQSKQTDWNKNLSNNIGSPFWLRVLIPGYFFLWLVHFIALCNNLFGIDALSLESDKHGMIDVRGERKYHAFVLYLTCKVKERKTMILVTNDFRTKHKFNIPLFWLVAPRGRGERGISEVSVRIHL